MPKEKIFNIPNILSILRGLASAVLVYLILENYSKSTIFFLFTAIALTDWLDGTIARKFDQKTKFGKYLDPVVDRVFMILFIAAAFIKFGIINNELEFRLLPLIMTRELIAAPFWIFARKFDLKVNVKNIGKLTTLLQSVTVPIVILNWGIAAYMIIITSITGIFSGITYAKDWKKENKNEWASRRKT